MVETVDAILIQTRGSEEKNKKYGKSIPNLFQVNGVDIG